jgi:hypothetical protein
MAARPSSPGHSSPVSVPPVAVAAEPTIIVVRERPRIAWMLGSAGVGALAAAMVMRLFVGRSAAPAPSKAGGAEMAAPQSSSGVDAAPTGESSPAAPPLLPRPSGTTAVVRFAEDQGVAICAPSAAPSPAAAPATQPHAIAAPPHPPPRAAARPGPPLMSLQASSPSAVAPEAPAKKRPLTPDEDLAEAQLKASMK